MIRLALGAVALSLVVSGCGGAGDQSSMIAAKIGSPSCTREQYEIANRIDGSKERLYDCEVNGQPTCVVLVGGIAQNVTAEVRLLYANALGGDQPVCLD